MTFGTTLVYSVDHNTSSTKASYMYFTTTDSNTHTKHLETHRRLQRESVPI